MVLHKHLTLYILHKYRHKKRRKLQSPSCDNATHCLSLQMQAIVQEGELNVDSSPLAMYNFFVERIRQNLHIVLTMSPIGDAFRNRLRKFPSLINCCTIDWFQVRKHFYNLY